MAGKEDEELKLEGDAGDAEPEPADAKDAKAPQKDKIELKKWNAVGERFSVALLASIRSYAQPCGAGTLKSTPVSCPSLALC